MCDGWRNDELGWRWNGYRDDHRRISDDFNCCGYFKISEKVNIQELEMAVGEKLTLVYEKHAPGQKEK